MGKDPAQPLGKTVNRKNIQQTWANDQKKQEGKSGELGKAQTPFPFWTSQGPQPNSRASEAGNLTNSGWKTFLIPHALLRFSLNDSIDPFHPIDEKIILTTSPKAQQVRTDQLKLVDVVADVDVGIEESFGNGLESVWQLLSHR